MLRGAIDYTAIDCVEGWIFSPEIDVRGRTVMAFVDDRCIGAGQIGRLRDDLAAAGLGNGEIGFHFGITPSDTEDLQRLVVRLEGSDFSLLQDRHRTKIDPTSKRLPDHRTPESVEWMRSQGWLDQTEYDFLHSITRFGRYDLSLRRSRKNGFDGGVDQPGIPAGKYLSLVHQRPVSAVAADFANVDDLVAATTAYVASRANAIIGIWAATAFELDIETAEATSMASEAASVGARLPIGPDRLLFVGMEGRIASATGWNGIVTTFAAEPL